MRIRVSVVIDAPPDVVWRAVEPIERHVDWMADAVSITFTSATNGGVGNRGVGTSFDCVTRIGPFRTTDRMTITQWVPSRAMGIEHRGVVTGRGRFTLEPDAGGRTNFSWSEELTFPLWMGGSVGAFVAAPVLRAIWRRNLRRLKTIVEAA